MVSPAPVRNQSKLTRIFRTELEILTFNHNSRNKETTTYDCPISTRVHRPCELFADCEFALRGSDSFRSFDPSSSRHMYTLGTYYYSVCSCLTSSSLMPDCSQPLGMESKRIPDSAITASSQLRQSHSASRARLRMQPAGWSAARKNKKQWLQIYLGAPYIISAIATQGLGRSKSRGEWVTKYKVSYSEDGQKWKIYKRAGKTKVL